MRPCTFGTPPARVYSCAECVVIKSSALLLSNFSGLVRFGLYSSCVGAVDTVVSFSPESRLWLVEKKKGSLVELVEQQPTTRCVMGSILAGALLETVHYESIRVPCLLPRGVAVDFGPKQPGWLINQLGNSRFFFEGVEAPEGCKTWLRSSQLSYRD